MQNQSLTFSEIKRRFPGLKPSRLDYLVREGLVDCRCNGRGKPRLYPLEAITQIESYIASHPITSPENGIEIERKHDQYNDE